MKCNAMRKKLNASGKSHDVEFAASILADIIIMDCAGPAFFPDVEKISA